jgi:hypothetical protein
MNSIKENRRSSTGTLALGIHEGARAWKVFELGLNESASREGIHIGSQGKAKSVVFTKLALKRLQRLLQKLFCESDEARAREPSEHVLCHCSLDHEKQSWENSFTVKEIVAHSRHCRIRVKRLNEVNADKDCLYFWQTTRLFPPRTAAGNRRGEPAKIVLSGLPRD